MSSILKCYLYSGLHFSNYINEPRGSREGKKLKGRCWRTKKTEKIPVIKMLKTIPPIFFPSLRCKRKAYRHCLSSKVLIKYDACVEEAHKKNLPSATDTSVYSRNGGFDSSLRAPLLYFRLFQ